MRHLEMNFSDGYDHVYVNGPFGNRMELMKK